MMLSFVVLICLVSNTLAANTWIPFGNKEYYYQPLCTFNSILSSAVDIQQACNNIDSTSRLAIGKTQSIRHFLANFIL